MTGTVWWPCPQMPACQKESIHRELWAWKTVLDTGSLFPEALIRMSGPFLRTAAHPGHFPTCGCFSGPRFHSGLRCSFPLSLWKLKFQWPQCTQWYLNNNFKKEREKKNNINEEKPKRVLKNKLFKRWHFLGKLAFTLLQTMWFQFVF